jgi:protein-tyrosine phosphatase
LLKYMRLNFKLKFAAVLLLLAWSIPSQALVTKYPTAEVLGKGPLPYNYRVIDQKIHAGGHPLNPGTCLRNSDGQVLEILNYLKSQGIKIIIDLENTWWIQNRYKRLLKQAGLKRMHVPMHAQKVPNAKEWEKIKEALKEPVYIHCKWGADRTGAIIGRYLLEEKGYSSQEAWEAVLSSGTHAGYLGGLKKGRPYENLKRFIYRGAE